jgi:hypothetical protein
MKNLHLLASAAIIFIVGIAYGANPSSILPRWFDFQVQSTDLTHVFRAMMGLYIAFAGLFLAGVAIPWLWKASTLCNIVMMGGLAAGRILSILVDGSPSPLFLTGFFVELVLMTWGIWQLRYFARSP